MARSTRSFVGGGWSGYSGWHEGWGWVDRRDAFGVAVTLRDMTVIGLDLGGTKCAVSVADGDGRIVRVEKFATTDVAATLAELFETVGKVLDEAGVDGELMFGVSCGGPLDLEAGLICAPPQLSDWERVPIVSELEGRFGGTAYLMNDATAGALAEWQYGAGCGCASLLFLTHGTGMGAGLVLNGRVYEGTTGDAGELGHWRLAADGPVGVHKAGSFEGFCAGAGIAQLGQRLAAERGGEVAFNPGRIEAITARHVAEAAAAGDGDAVEIFRVSGDYLGQALAMVMDLLNPELIVLGSLYARCRSLLEPAMRAAIEREALGRIASACRVEASALGEEIGNVAAVSVALYRSGRIGG